MIITILRTAKNNSFATIKFNLRVIDYKSWLNFVYRHVKNAWVYRNFVALHILQISNSLSLFNSGHIWVPCHVQTVPGRPFCMPIQTLPKFMQDQKWDVQSDIGISLKLHPNVGLRFIFTHLQVWQFRDRVGEKFGWFIVLRFSLSELSRSVLRFRQSDRY